MDTLCTGSAPGVASATSACPISCVAATVRSRGDSTRLLRASPAMSRSTATVKSASPTASAPRRVAASAASFTRLARSAPVNPGVSAATASSSSPGSSGVLRTCTRSTCTRPARSGRSTSTCRSKRPARSSAASRISGRLVAASRITRESGVKPSISASSWLSVCSFSSLDPVTTDAPRERPSASISSMNTMQGACCRAWRNRSRTRAAPTPTNSSTNSEPLMEKKGTSASPATARASSVLPVPGGPTSSTPRGTCAPSRPKAAGLRRNATTSRSSALASSTPATSLKVMGTRSAYTRAPLRPKPSTPVGCCPSERRMRNDQKASMTSSGMVHSSSDSSQCARGSPAKGTPRRESSPTSAGSTFTVTYSLPRAESAPAGGARCTRSSWSPTVTRVTTPESSWRRKVL